MHLVEILSITFLARYFITSSLVVSFSDNHYPVVDIVIPYKPIGLSYKSRFFILFHIYLHVLSAHHSKTNSYTNTTPPVSNPCQPTNTYDPKLVPNIQ